MPLFTDFSVTLPSNSKDQECMNSNSKLKIVWMVCGVAIVLLFCTQAYWLHLQCQYSLNQQVEQFKKDCDEVLAQDLKNRKKLQENSSTKGRRDTVMLKVESQYDMKKGYSRTTLSFWNNHRFLVRLNDPDLTGDDAYLIISRYLAYIGKHPSLAAYQRLLDDKGYGKIVFFRHQDYKTVFLNAKYDVEGRWSRMVTVKYQTNPMFRQGISFQVPIPITRTLKAMMWQLIGSIFLFFILIGCLYYLVKTIVFQKRIDGIRHEFLKNMIYELKQPKEGDKGEESAVFIGSIVFYYAQNELQCGNSRVVITSRQAEILKLLAENQNQLVERDFILNEVWGDDSYSNSLALNVQITYLRRALNLDEKVSIEAVIKKGYILRTC
jgi:hypothetical protein